MNRSLLAALALGVALTSQPALSATYPYTLISRVMEANPKVVALAIDFGADLPINWQLASYFSVSAELLPVRNYAGDLIGNSAVARAPRTIIRAYTSAKPQIGSPSQGRYAIIEMNADDTNASSLYGLFNPGIRQVLPYKDKMVYDVRLLHDLNALTPPVSPKQPGAAINLIHKDASFKQAGARIDTADDFVGSVYEMPANKDIKFLAHHFYKPPGLAPQAKVPLVVFLHGSGQSHDYVAFPNDPGADSLGPLLANQGGVTWIENGPEKAFVLVPQVPARDTKDAEGELGWRSADTQKLLLTLIDKLIAENPAIDTNRLYLTGLSLGAMGSWKIITHPDPVISRKFAAAALFAGVPTMKIFAPVPGETPIQKQARQVADVKAIDYSRVSIPLWLGHANTDPVVNHAGSRVPFAQLTGKADVNPAGDLSTQPGVMKSATPLVRHYEAPNRFSGTEVRYTEYQYNDGDRFRDLGMATRNGHNSWEASYKDQAMIDWMFRQTRRLAP